MTLEESYLLAFNELKNQLSWDADFKSQAISLLDLTLLDEEASLSSLQHLSEKANQHRVAALCLLPQHLNAVKLLPEINLATVVNFPEGSQSTASLLAAIEKLINEGLVAEIDYVFPHQTYLEGEQQTALYQCLLAYQLCQQNHILFKVILETGALPSLDFIYQLSKAILNQGCDFLKTSTGKIVQGATPAALFAMLKAIQETGVDCGVKVSGGVKTKEQAFLYMNLARYVKNKPLDKSWFRIGASSLLDELLT